MEMWELDYRTTQNDNPQFQELVSREILFTKMCSTIAKNIILTVNQTKRPLEEVNDAIVIWLQIFSQEKINFDKGDTNTNEKIG